VHRLWPCCAQGRPIVLIRAVFGTVLIFSPYFITQTIDEMAVQLAAGQLLYSTALLNDTYFENSIILLAVVNAEGALGFVLNKPFGKNLNDLVAFSHCYPFPFNEGGPVDQEHLYVIHQLPSLIKNSIPVAGSICYSGNFQQTLQLINQEAIPFSAIKLLVGYCGWDAGELEAEIAEGSWTLQVATPELVFARP
jgi:putative transcriptional regulator